MRDINSQKVNIFGWTAENLVMYAPKILQLWVVYIPKIGVVIKLLTHGGCNILLTPTPMLIYDSGWSASNS